MDTKDRITEKVQRIKDECDNYLLYSDEADSSYTERIIDRIIDGARELILIQLEKICEEESKCL